MEESLSIDNQIEKRKEKIIKWFKDPYNLALFGILVFAFAIRLYYFILTKNQPLWWDELCYGSLAKNMVTGIGEGSQLIIGESLIRPLGLPFLWSLLLRLGFNEIVNRFVLCFIPSIISVFFVYLIGKEVFNKRVGLISSLIFSVLWIHLFYTLRFLTHMLSLSLMFSSIYFFILSIKKEFNYNYFLISLVLSSITLLFRFPDGLLFGVYLFALILSNNLHLNKKKFWFYSLIGLSPLFFFFIFNYITYGNIFPALFGGDYLIGGSEAKKSINWGILSFTHIFLKTLYFLMFLIGSSLILFELSIGYNHLSKSKKLRGYLILFLIFIMFNAFFIFYMRGAEDRWLFPTTLSLVLFSGFGLENVYLFFKRYNKILAVIILCGILIFGAYGQILHANQLIEIKRHSYLQIKEAFLWIGENSEEGEIIVGEGIEPYAVYYANRQYLLFSNESSLEGHKNANYLVYHSFTSQSEGFIQYIQNNTNLWQPVNAWFFDEAKTQPATIIFEKAYEK